MSAHENAPPSAVTERTHSATSPTCANSPTTRPKGGDPHTTSSAPTLPKLDSACVTVTLPLVDPALITICVPVRV